MEAARVDRQQSKFAKDFGLDFEDRYDVPNYGRMEVVGFDPRGDFMRVKRLEGSYAGHVGVYNLDFFQKHNAVKIEQGEGKCIGGCGRDVNNAESTMCHECNLTMEGL